MHHTVSVEPGNQSDAVVQIGCHFHELALDELLALFRETAQTIQKIRSSSYDSLSVQCPIDDCLNCQSCKELEGAFREGFEEGFQEGIQDCIASVQNWLRDNHPEILDHFIDTF